MPTIALENSSERTQDPWNTALVETRELQPEERYYFIHLVVHNGDVPSSDLNPEVATSGCEEISLAVQHSYNIYREY